MKSETWRANYLRDPKLPIWIMEKVSSVDALVMLMLVAVILFIRKK